MPVPGWALGVVALWLGSVAAAAWLGRTFGVAWSPCLWRRATGVPCPTCGATRAALAALDGRLADAFLLNPMVVLGAAAASVWLAVRLGLGRRPAVHLSPAGRRAAWCVLAGAVALNWAYVIWR